jgi:hypothetical protein
MRVHRCASPPGLTFHRWLAGSGSGGSSGSGRGGNGWDDGDAASSGVGGESEGTHAGAGPAESGGSGHSEAGQNPGGNAHSGAGQNTGGNAHSGAGQNTGGNAHSGAGQNTGGNAASPQGGTNACVPGTVGCACAAGLTCEEDSACRSQVCTPIPNPPTAAVEGHYELPPGFFALALDHERNRLFASYGGDGVVRVLDLDDGDVTTVTTGHIAEHLHFDPVRDEVLVSLATQSHSAYWWDEEQEGYVAAIDALTLADPDPIWIPMDPWQIVADGRGHAVVSGGSGQWTSMMSIDLETEWTQQVSGPYHGANIRIHPARDRLYAADTGLSPSDIERYNLSADGQVTAAYDSPYHGDYPMCGDLRIHPSGTTIYTKCGHIFLASNSQSTDMTYVANMGIGWLDLGFDTTGRYALVLGSDARALYLYDTETLSPGSAIDVDPADRLLVGSDYVVLTRQAARGAVPYTDVELLRLDYPD